jgi:hypothetical protein
MTNEETINMGATVPSTKVLAALAVVVALACAALAPQRAAAVYGDGFGIHHAEGPALPGPSSFWAGTCDLGIAPAIGEPIANGVGARPDTVYRAAPSPNVYPNGPFSAPEALPAPAQAPHCIDHGTPAQGVPAWAHLPAWRLSAATEAGAHPDGTLTFAFAREPGPDDPGSQAGFPETLGSVDNIRGELPPGLAGDPTAVPKCTAEQFAERPTLCPPASQVGIAQIALRQPLQGGMMDDVYPVYNLEPRRGRPAELGIPEVAGFTSVRIEAKARTDGDFGITTFVAQISAALDVYSQTVTLWGVPWAASHDAFRAPPQFIYPGIPHSGLAPGDQVSYDPSWGPIRPFISNPTECDGQSPVTRLAVDSYQNPGAFTAAGDPDPLDLNWKRTESPAPPVTGCAKPPFDPSVSVQPTATAADSASGLTAAVSIPQNDDPPLALASNPDEGSGAPAHWRSEAGRAAAQLDRAVVTLPEGMSVNPSGAAGLTSCSDAQMGVTAVGSPYLFDHREPSCPLGSRIGTVVARTPLLEEPLTGELILGTPRSIDPASGQMFRLFLVVRNRERGLLAKVFGSTVADPATGRLTATFDKNPRVPMESIEVTLKGGPRGMLATPASCGHKTTSATLSPWTAVHDAGGPVRQLTDGFQIGGDCANSFAPGVEAGMSSRSGGGGGTFSFRVARQPAQQMLRGISVDMPTGLLASLRDVPLCSNAQAAAGACPASSRVGTADAAAGAGDPFWVERPGSIYLTEGYKGGELGLAAVVPVEAGPFRGPLALRTIVVRQAVHVDRRDASVRVVSDPLPQIWHGIPLRTREVRVAIDRPGFMRNPSDCSPKEIQTELVSDAGALASAASRFQSSGCRGLAFRPRLGMRLSGRRQMRSGGHPGVRAVVTQKVGEAGIERAEVRLPRSLALDPDNARALCEFVDGTKPDLENHCPKGSIVGRARAVSPLLNRPLSGNVYFVKNVRTDPDTGAQIRTLPMIVAALRGEIAINLRGESDVKGPRLVNTFDQVPDAPVSQFNLNIAGGKRGILVVTENRRGRINLCARAQIAEADMDGHNGKRFDRNVRLKTACGKRKSSKRTASRRR